MRMVPKRGFTLLEILIALAIMTILAGVGYASIRGMTERYRVDAATAQVASDLVRVRSYAQTKNVSASWKKISSNSYELNLGGAKKTYLLPNGIRFVQPADGAKVEYTAPYGEVSINGSTVAALKIVLSNGKGESTEVHVVGVTGKVIRR